MKNITVRVVLDEKTFRRFAVFDTMARQGIWRRPALFAGILLAFALLCLLSGRPQARMIAAVLSLIGVGLPLVYVGTFLRQVHAQAKKLGLPCPFYTVTLGEPGVRVVNNAREERPLALPWERVEAVYRGRGCVYLYVAASRAFLLPDGQADVPSDELWRCLRGWAGGRASKIRSV